MDGDAFDALLSGDGDQYFKTFWRVFFQALTGPKHTGKSVTVSALASVLDKLNPERTSHIREVYELRAGAHRPEPWKAWMIATALRQCSVEWSNGLVLLLAAGRYVDFVGVVANVSTAERHHIVDVALHINEVVNSSIFNLGHDPHAFKALLENPHHKAFVEGRSWHEKYLAASPILDIAWASWEHDRRFPGTSKKLDLLAQRLQFPEITPFDRKRELHSGLILWAIEPLKDDPDKHAI